MNTTAPKKSTTKKAASVVSKTKVAVEWITGGPEELKAQTPD